MTERRTALLAVTVVFAVEMGIVHALTRHTFPNGAGMVAADYIVYLARMLDGYFWWLENGWTAVRWFTPALCAGVPAFADPQDIYFSVPQALFILLGPLTGIYAAFLLFQAAAFLGAYALLRRSFATGPWPALAGATILLFNGFFVERLLAAQIQQLGWALTPLVALAATAPLPDAPGRRRWAMAGWSGLGAALLAYMFQSGMASIMPPTLIAIALVALLHDLYRGGDRTWSRLALMGFGSLALCAAKFSASAAYIEQFPRTLYPLPGFEGVFHTLVLAARALAGIETDLATTAGLTNNHWMLAEYEYRYAVGPVALLLALAAAGGGMVRLARTGVTPGQGLRLAALAAGLAVPVAVNVYSPAWNEILKSLPVLGSSSMMLRWWSAYIPVVVVAVALGLEALAPRVRLMRAAALLAGLSALAAGYGVNPERFEAQSYRPVRLLRAFEAAKASGHGPAISHMVAMIANGEPMRRARTLDEALAMGGSHIFCYQTQFGYDLELMPLKTIRPGPALAAVDGALNVKNPACYVHPAANGCEPGDHFRADRIDAARDFLRRRPFPFEMPARQVTANAVNLAALAGWLALMGALAWRWIRTDADEA